MFNLFKKEPTLKEQQRQCDRALAKVGRNVERDRRELEREEKKIEMEIKKLVKENNKEGCTILAKRLIQIRKQKNQTYNINSKLAGISAQNKSMVANAKLADSLNTTAKTMGQMNAVMKPENIAAASKNFSQQLMKMDMMDEMINDTLDDMLTESGDEEEEQQIVQQVLDEIGIETSSKMAAAPAPDRTALGETSRRVPLSDEDIEAQLAKLRS